MSAQIKMKFKHSPGPFSCELNGDIRDANGVFVAQTFDNPNDGTQPMGEETSDYNRCLLTAAPETLAALVACYDVMMRAFPKGLPVAPGTLCEETDWAKAIRMAGTAIGNSTGEP